MRHFFDSVDKVPLPERGRQDTQDTVNGFESSVKVIVQCHWWDLHLFHAREVLQELRHINHNRLLIWCTDQNI